MSPPVDPVAASSSAWPRDLAGEKPGDTPPPSGARRTWFGWSATSLPVAPLLLLGVLLGPHGLIILTPPTLAAFDPAMPVALAALGALVGLMPAMQGHVLPALGSAALAAGSTVSLVALAFAGGALAIGGQSTIYVWVLPLVLGVAAASSLVIPLRRPSESLSWSNVVIEAETFMSVVAGGLLLAFARQTGLAATMLWLLQAVAIVALLGLAGWLLPRRGAALAEQRVFAVATLLLIGGAADYLSFSALAGGLCAGLLWAAFGGPSRDSLQGALLYALHPFTALVLVVAGAHVELTAIALGLGAAYATIRVLARSGAAALGARLSPREESSGYLPLIGPGVFGVAFALSAFRSLGPELSMAISIVVVGTILNEMAAMFVTPRRETE